MQVPAKRAAMDELLAHPWIAQYHTPPDSLRIPAYHGIVAPVPKGEAAGSSVLDSAAVLSSSGEGFDHSSSAPSDASMAETIRPVSMR